MLCQSWQELEIIVVNDGSADDTENVINSLAGDSRIKYIPQANKGCSGAKNTGLQAATGDFVQYLDADDILSKDKIEKQVEVLKDRPFGVAICNTKIFHQRPGDTDIEINPDFLYPTENVFGFLLNLYGLNGKYGMIQPNAFLISKQLSDAAGYWDMSISPSPDEDGEYFCRTMLKANAIYVTEGYNYYRKNPHSKSSLSNQHNHQYAKGALASLVLKANHMLAIEATDRVKQTMAFHFAAFIYLYHGVYNDLTEQAEQYIYGMGLKRIPKAGGKKFQKMASLFGFKQALAVKNIFG